MSALTAASCSSSSGAAARPLQQQQQRRFAVRCRRAAAVNGRVRAALWTPPGYGSDEQQQYQQQQQQQRPKGYDRPWIQANGQPIMAPRTADMAGDPFGLLLRQRIVFLGGEVDDFGADAIVSQLLLLDQQDATKDIKLFINSPGGSVTAGMGIYDAMMLCRADVQTYCFGLAASMGAFLLGAGRRGKRHSMPNSRIMIHQPLGGASGQAVDIEIQAKEIMYHKANLNRIMADYTGQPLAKIEEDTDRDRYMSPVEARDYGLIDHIIGGEEAVFKVKGSNKRFPAVKEEYVTDASEARRSIVDGDSFLPDAGSYRFRSRTSEPYMPAQAPGMPWFTVKRVSKDEYYRALAPRRAADGAEGAGATDAAAEDAAAVPAEGDAAPSEGAAAPKRSLKEKYDEF